MPHGACRESLMPLYAGAQQPVSHARPEVELAAAGYRRTTQMQAVSQVGVLCLPVCDVRAGSSSAVTLTRVAGGHTGTGAALLTNAGISPATCTLTNDPLPAATAGTYTTTLWLRSDVPGATITLALRQSR